MPRLKFSYKICLLISCCLLTGSNSFLFAQNILQPSPVKGELLGVKQGLSQGMINCIYQDKEGYLWISTKDGLNRYDGYNIITYRNNPNDPYSLPDNYCNATVEDDKGNFWVGTNTRGLFLFDKTTERFYPVAAINSHKENLCIREIKYANGKLYIKTWADAMIADISQVDIKHDRSTAGVRAKIIFSYNQVQPNIRYRVNTSIFSIDACNWMPDDSFWINFSDSIFYVKPNTDLSKYSITSFSHTSMGITGNDHQLVCFFSVPGEPESMVIAWSNKVIHVNTISKQVIYTKTFPVINTEFIRPYRQINDGSICTFTDSFAYSYHPATKKAEIIPVIQNDLPEGCAINLFIDANGLQWYGTNGYGLIKKDSRKLNFKSFTNTVNTAIFWQLPTVAMPQIPEPLRQKYEFNRVALDKKGIYWAFLANNWTQLNYLFSGNTANGKVTQHMGLADNHLRQTNIYNDPADRLWVYYQDLAKKNWIARMDKSTGTMLATYNIPEDIDAPNPYVSQFYFDEKGLMWLTTINGLYSFNETTKAWKHWKNIPGNNNSLSSDKLLSICPDPASPQKYLWIGTEGAGFNRFEISTGTWLRFDEKDGLPNNVAYCILSDSLNNLWISTNKGLSCFNPAQKTFRNFTDDDGLPGNEFNRNTCRRLQNGELMFGGVDGFVIFNPKEVLQKQPAAPLVFTGITVLNKPINWKTDSSNNLQAPVGYAKTLTLQPGQNIFSISFATLEFRNNEKKMYRYKLDGFDNDWTSPNSKNEVTYTNLSPGTYTFMVMGANTDGVWNEKPIGMKIIVLPFWYQTWWFKILMLLLFVAGLYAFYRYRVQQALKLEKLRNRIARDLHDEIGSTLSSVSIYAESAKKVTAGNQKAEGILSKINAGTSEMMEAMSDIVWAVNTGSDHFDGLANRMRSFSVQVTETKNIDLHFTDNKEIPDIALDMEQRKNIYLICKEAISNAVKYSNCNLLEVLISKEQHRLHIHIRDNGRGFALNNPATTISEHSFGGNGIKNMKSRASEINSIFELVTQPGKGTSIKLIVPLKKS